MENAAFAAITAHMSSTQADYRRYTGGIDGLVAASSKLATPDISIIHIITPVDIEIRGKFAVAESLAQLSCRFLHDGHKLDLYSYCRLLTRLEKAEGKWYILRTDVIYIRDAIFPVGNSPMPDFSDIEGFGWKRPSYQFVYWHVNRRGLKLADDLPGEDDPGTVEKLYEENRLWLASVEA